MVCYHPAKFGKHGDCDCVDMMILVCHVILQDKVAKSFHNFIRMSHLRYLTTLQGLVAICTVVVEI